MEKQSGPTSLELKLSLLKSLKEGTLDKTQQLLSQLKTTSKTHLQLYQQFYQFVSDHKVQIKQMNEEEKGEDIPPVIVDGDSEESWLTDDSVSLSSEDEPEEQPLQKKNSIKGEPKVMKSLANSKSAALLKPVKEGKKHFFVQTKTKENLISSTMNLRQSSPSSKLLAENKSTMVTMTASKSSFMSKVPSKKNIKPYFPPINASKPCLKLS